MALNLRPLGDRVVIELGEGADVTTDGILLPETAKEKPQQEIIPAVGAGRRAENGKLIKMAIKIDSKVMYGKYSGTEIKVNVQKMLIVKDADILAIVID